MTVIIPGFDVYCPHCRATKFVTTAAAAARWCQRHQTCNPATTR